MELKLPLRLIVIEQFALCVQWHAALTAPVEHIWQTLNKQIFYVFAVFAAADVWGLAQDRWDTDRMVKIDA